MFGACRAVLAALVLIPSAFVASACDHGSQQSVASTARSASVKPDPPWLQTLRADWSHYNGELRLVGATCNPRHVTVKTMNACKTEMLALNQTDNDVRSALSGLNAPSDVQPAIDHLRASLAALNQAQLAIIHFIDMGNERRFRGSGTWGSPREDAIKGANTAIREVDSVYPNADLLVEFFVPAPLHGD